MAENKTPTGARLGAGQITLVDRLCQELAGPARRSRQDAAHTLAELAREHPDNVDEKADVVIPALIGALSRNEAQTRWESLDALSELVASHTDAVAGALEGAETSLFDENSATVRIAAFRLLARYGATSPEHSDRVWPLLDEAIQCFHGDTGYRGMLEGLLELARGSASAATLDARVSRITFDAESGRGYVKSCSAEIVQAAKAK